MFVIDGAMQAQFDDAAMKGFVDFCREITGTPENEKVRVSCWFMTHNHSDHFGGFMKTIRTYPNVFFIERVVGNLLPPIVDKNSFFSVKSVLDEIAIMYPGVKYLKMHTGMDFNIANLNIKVLCTHEDLILPTKGISFIRDSNDASTVLKLTIEDISYLVLGDVATVGESAIIENFTSNELKSDIVQVSHHTWNWLNYIYDIAAAKYAIFTQSEGASNRTLGVNAKRVREKVKEYAQYCFYSGNNTTGLLIKSGVITVAFVKDVIYDSPDYDWGYVYEGIDMSKVKDYSKINP